MVTIKHQHNWSVIQSHLLICHPFPTQPQIQAINYSPTSCQFYSCWSTKEQKSVSRVIVLIGANVWAKADKKSTGEGFILANDANDFAIEKWLGGTRCSRFLSYESELLCPWWVCMGQGMAVLECFCLHFFAEVVDPMHTDTLKNQQDHSSFLLTYGK